MSPHAARDMDIRLLDPGVSDDAELVDRLTSLINDVYATAESGLWRDGATRTTATEVAELIAAGQIAVATRGGELAGSVRLHDVGEDASEFGLLVAAPEHPSTGAGRALLDFAERHSQERGPPGNAARAVAAARLAAIRARSS